MKPKQVFLLLLVLLLSVVGPVFGHTILIDTWEYEVPVNMEIEARIRVVSAETGIMDSLFDNGHIFFNIYSAPGEEGFMPEFSQTFQLAAEIGADYVLRLNPDEEGLGWLLYEADGENLLSEGYVSISEVDPDLKPIEMWTRVGLLVAGDMISRIG